MGCQQERPPSDAPAEGPAPAAAPVPADRLDHPVQKALDAFNRKDWKGVAQAFAADGKLTLIDSTQEPRQGREAIAALLSNLALVVPDLHVKPVRLIASDAVWVVELVLCGTQLGELFGQPVSQRRLGIQLAVFANTKDGLITQAFVCANPQAIVEQIKAEAGERRWLPALPTRAELRVDPAAVDPKVVEGFFEVFETGDLARLESLVSDRIAVHAYGDGKMISGLETLRLTLVREREAFDGQIKIEQAVSSGPYVAALVQISGTLKADVGELKATGRTFAERGIDVFRIENGKIVEWDNYRNLLDLKRQLGLLQPQKPATP